MRLLLVASLALAVAAPAGAAHADRPLCRRDAIYRGAPIDLDVKQIELEELFRLLADVGRVNLVIADGVAGKTTLRLHRVPWDQVVCNVAAAHGLFVTVDGNVVLVRRAAPR